MACGTSEPGHDAGADASFSDAAADVADSGVTVHPADASPQIIITDESPNDAGLLVFAPPLTDASTPLFKITNITPNETALPTLARIGPDGWTLWGD